MLTAVSVTLRPMARTTLVKVVRATLDQHRLCLELRRKTSSQVEVMFKTNQANYTEVSRVLRIMIPCLAVVDPGAG